MNKKTSTGIILFVFNLAALAQDPIATPYWRSSFENGFPGGEWLNYDNGSWSQDGSNSGISSTWTIVPETDLSEGAIHGQYMYKGWINGAVASESHRAYPVIHVDYASPLVNSWWAYIDTDYGDFPGGGWHHFGTWGPNPDWQVHTMSVVGSGRLEFAHVGNFQVMGDIDMPVREWVRFTVYINYSAGSDNLILAWMNGSPILSAQNVQPGGSNLMRAHWGLYASGNLAQGMQYNDDIQIWGLSAPWTDPNREPPSPYGTVGITASPAEVPRSEILHSAMGIHIMLQGNIVGEGLLISDLSGREVIRLRAKTSGGNQKKEYFWNEKSAEGNPVTPGIYHVRLSQASIPGFLIFVD